MKKLLMTAATLVALATSTMANAADYGADAIQPAIDTHRANQLRFARDYIGRSIEFIWTFHSVREKTFGSGYVVKVGNGSFGGGVECTVTDQALLDTIVEWNKGQKARIYGVIDHVDLIGDLQLKRCRIEAVKS
jgi:hypothetical protein